MGDCIIGKREYFEAGVIGDANYINGSWCPDQFILLPIVFGGIFLLALICAFISVKKDIRKNETS